MGCKYAIFVGLLILLLGCSIPTVSQKKSYTESYRHSVKEHMQAIVSEFQGGNFPYYHWTSPLVQNVRVPGHIANGVFIPAHQELVIIKPGEWAQAPAYPIESQGENHEKTQTDMDVADITHLPGARSDPSSATAVEPAGKDRNPAAGMVPAK